MTMIRQFKYSLSGRKAIEMTSSRSVSVVDQTKRTQGDRVTIPCKNDSYLYET